jgi:hypothetical protein
MVTLIVAAVVTAVLVAAAVWAGSKLDEEDFDGAWPWQDDSFN